MPAHLLSRLTHTRSGSWQTAIGLIATALSASLALAQPVLITAPQTLAPGASTITPTAGGPPVSLATADITVQGTSLTVNGRHTIRSLNLTSGAVVNHGVGFSFDYSAGAGTDVVSGMHLIVQANPSGGTLSIDATSSIDASASGFGPASGPAPGINGFSEYGSGGGHGGCGGASSSFAGGSATYGSITQPATFGSGGGNTNGDGGGNGGGVIRLTVSGALTINGAILAAGGDGQGIGASGAGGSIWITTGTLAGTGSGGGIVTNGGTTIEGIPGGGGGAGRIAIYDTTFNYTGPITSMGGGGFAIGGPGTYYRKNTATAAGDLTISGPGPVTPVLTGGLPLNVLSVKSGATVSLDQLVTAVNVVLNSGTLTHSLGNPTGLQLTVSGAITIDAASRIDVSGRGHSPASGPGAGTTGFGEYGSGGGHAGTGGASSTIVGGAPYGSISQPTAFGSGGGSTNTELGGAGGGRVRIIVTGALTINGTIAADGESPVGIAAGGGGGSIWVTAGSIHCAGTITANGGSTAESSNAGGGGGGRVALYYASLILEGDVQTIGGTGFQAGGPGTAYYKPDSNPGAFLTIAGAGAETPLNPTGLTLHGVVLTAGARIAIDQPLNAINLSILGGAVLTHSPANPAGLSITLASSMYIDADSRIDVSGRGLAAAQGPGGGANGLGVYASGAGHGGHGGQGSQHAGGGTYGSIYQPVLLGSGGGSTNDNTGGNGGGVVRVSAASPITVHGAIRANGDDAFGIGAGGAGGSVWLSASTVTGGGDITANGGASDENVPAGGGGGGRIALYYSANTIGGVVTAAGGNGAQPGGPGTVYLAPASGTPTVIWDNLGSEGAPNLFNVPTNFASNVILRGAAIISHDPSGSNAVQWTIAGDLSIDATSRIDVRGKGFPIAAGPGAGTNGNGQYGSGGGHGGIGGASASFAGGPTYGDELQPVTHGSGGGRTNGEGGAEGGGAVRLDVGGTLLINGAINADGGSYAGAAGSGAGGSIWLLASGITGSGFISADGGFTGTGNPGGAGAGGRIALYSCLLALPAANITANGNLGWVVADDGTIQTTSVEILVQPVSTYQCFLGVTVFDLSLVGPGSFNYQWRKDNVDLVDSMNQYGTIISGATTPRLTLTNVTDHDAGTYDCVISTVCGSLASTTALLSVAAPCALADIVSDSADTSFCANSSVGPEDLEAFVNAFIAENPLADVASDSADTVRTPNGSVGPEDIEAFVNSYIAGC